MNDIYLPANQGLPEIDFRFSRHRLRLSGHSFSSNPAAFYAPLNAAMMSYLGRTRSDRIHVELQPDGFDLPSQQVLRAMMGMLDRASLLGNEVRVVWQHAPEDLLARDLGLDMLEDCIALSGEVRVARRRS